MDSLVVVQVWDAEANPIGRGARPFAAAPLSAAALESLRQSALTARSHAVVYGSFSEAVALEGRACDVTWFPLSGADGKNAGLVSTVFDSDARHRTDTERARRAEFERLIRELSSGSVDATGDSLDWQIDRALQSMTGLGDCLEPPPPGEAPAVEASGPSLNAARPGGGETVLLVEDSASLRRLVRDMLRDHGYRVLEAGCPLEALDVCERNANQIDLILTDVMMPSMSGRHFADVARESHGIRQVAYISGYDDHSLAADGVLLGTARLLQKPFLEADLLRFVRQALDS